MREGHSSVTNVWLMGYKNVSGDLCLTNEHVTLNAANQKVPVMYVAVLPMFVSESVQITDDI